MAIKQVSFGSVGPFFYDDTLFNAVTAEGQIFVSEAPTADEHVVRQVDMDSANEDYQLRAEEDQANGYAGLNASSRITKGVDTTDDVIIDLATKGLVLKDTQGTPHYWRVTVTTLGVLTTSDLGTTKP